MTAPEKTIVYFQRNKSVHFQSKNDNDKTYEEENGWKCVYFPPDLAFFSFAILLSKYFSLFCTLTWWRANNLVLGMTRRNEETIINRNCTDDCNQSYIC